MSLTRSARPLCWWTDPPPSRAQSCLSVTLPTACAFPTKLQDIQTSQPSCALLLLSRDLPPVVPAPRSAWFPWGALPVPHGSPTTGCLCTPLLSPHPTRTRLPHSSSPTSRWVPHFTCSPPSHLPRTQYPTSTPKGSTPHGAVCPLPIHRLPYFWQNMLSESTALLRMPSAQWRGEGRW